MELHERSVLNVSQQVNEYINLKSFASTTIVTFFFAAYSKNFGVTLASEPLTKEQCRLERFKKDGLDVEVLS